jgi:hypothetical protein
MSLGLTTSGLSAWVVARTVGEESLSAETVSHVVGFGRRVREVGVAGPHDDQGGHVDIVESGFGRGVARPRGCREGGGAAGPGQARRDGVQVLVVVVLALSW